MIKNIEELKVFVGPNKTIAYASKLAIFAIVEGNRINLPISEKTLKAILK